MATLTLDVFEIMKALSSIRMLFHSEADFQHAFAWEVHRRFPNAQVRLERPITVNGKVLHLDFIIQLDDRAVAVELKYKTRKLLHEFDGEEYRLASHSAQDIGRYDFIKDICRLEQITANLKNCEGWAILLTNDSPYWKSSFGRDTVDAEFRIEEGRILHGPLSWTADASPGTMKNRKARLEVNGQYNLGWKDFSAVNAASYNYFRYLAVHVPGN